MGILDDLDPDRVYGEDTGDDRGLAINPWLPYTTNRAGSPAWVQHGTDRQWSVPGVFREGVRGWDEMLERYWKSGEVKAEDILRIGSLGMFTGGLFGPKATPSTMAAGGRRGKGGMLAPVATMADQPSTGILAATPDPPGAIPAADRLVTLGHNQPPVPAYLDPEGGAIKGAAYSKASSAALAEVERRGAGAGPLDLSGNQRIPDIEQEPIPRYDPTAGRGRGVPVHMTEALANPDVIRAVDAAIDRGMGMGADKWYHNKALYNAFTSELGPEEGHKQFQKYMDFQSAASPGSDVPTNIRNASYYFVNPQGLLEFTGSSNPYPYGHKAQNLHRSNADLMAADQGEWGGYTNLVKNPKPPSYGTNLGGNLTPVAGDTHAMRLVVMNTRDPRFLATTFDDMSPTNPFDKGTDISKLSPEDRAKASKALKWGELVTNEDGTPLKKDGKYKIRYNPQRLYAEGKLSMDEALQSPTMWRSKPNENEYAALENFYAERARAKGLAPAEGQSAAWAGGGEQTGLGTPSNRTFGQMHNERVLYTAIMRGEDPKETLRKLVRGEAPLLSRVGPPVSPDALPQGLLSEDEYRRKARSHARGLLDEQVY